MAPSNSELFNSKVTDQALQELEFLGSNPLGSNPLESNPLGANPPVSVPPISTPPKPAPTLLAKAKLMRVASRPIPLRTLITLFNYERSTMDWRYENFSLYHSSEMKSRAIGKSKTIYTEGARCFCYDDSPYPSDQQPWRQATCRVHPEAPPETRQLNSTQLERAFYESRSAHWGTGTGSLYQLFFQFCGKDQALKIQIKNEQQVLVNACDMFVLNFILRDPRHRNLNGEHQTPKGVFDDLILGNCEGSVLVFPPPLKDLVPPDKGEHNFLRFYDWFVVDMLHMQYGKKGLFEEPYFLGNGKQWERFMRINVCADFAEWGIERYSLTEKQEKCSTEDWNWLNKLSLRVFHRWLANDQNPNFLWCSYCGIGGANLTNCCGEGEEITRYCSEEHRERGWTLHQFNCKKNTEGSWAPDRCCEHCGIKLEGKFKTCKKCEKSGKIVKYCDSKHRKDGWQLHQYQCESMKYTASLWGKLKRSMRK